MKKILLEIAKLLLKLAKLAFWKWLRPWLGKILLAFVAFLAVVAVLGFLIAGAC